MTDLRVGVAQLASTDDAAANIDAAVALAAEAAAAGAGLLVLPEYTLAWAPRLRTDLADHHAQLAERLLAVAVEHRIWVIVGTLEPVGDRVSNVALVIGPDGVEHGRYRKVHLFDAFGVQESEVLDAGPTGVPLVIEVDGWRVGVATCYDLRFPESFRVLLDDGAEVLAVGAAWAAGPGKADQLDVLARARALENTCYLLLASQCGDGRTGRSAVVDPLGEVQAQADEQPTLLIADLSHDRLDEVRTRVPALAHRRYAVVPKD